MFETLQRVANKPFSLLNLISWKFLIKNGVATYDDDENSTASQKVQPPVPWTDASPMDWCNIIAFNTRVGSRGLRRGRWG